MIKLVFIEQTCEACPSQWTAFDNEDNYIYIRYRWGYLRIEYFDLNENINGYIYGKQLGDSYDGVLSYEELKEATKDVLEFPSENKEMTKQEYLNTINREMPNTELVNLANLLEERDKKIEELEIHNKELKNTTLLLYQHLSQIRNNLIEYQQKWEGWRQDLESLLLEAYMQGKLS